MSSTATAAPGAAPSGAVAVDLRTHSREAAPAQAAPALVRFEGVTKTYGTAKAPVHAVRGVDLDVRRGEVFGIVGTSGAGKSTLIRLVNALERPTAGRVVVDGQDLGALSERQLRTVRRRIGMIFQQFNLLSSRTVAGNVAYPLKLAGGSRAEVDARVRELLEFVGLSDKARQYPDQLSGGQKQRVGIARALATSPEILLCDEATSALDPQTTRDVLALLRRANAEYGVTILLITHEMDVVRSICDRVAVMADGLVVESGDVYDVFAGPREQITRDFVHATLRDRPDARTLERLRRRHPGRIVTFTVREGTGEERVLSQLVREHSVEFTVVYGGISDIADRPFGSLTVELIGAPTAVDAVVAGLAAVTDVEEAAA